jgi:hypothetical protein
LKDGLANRMSLKRTGLLRQAVAGAFASFIVLGSQAPWLTYLILYSDWSSFWGFQTFIFLFPSFFLLPIDILVAAAPFITIWQWRSFHAAATDTEQSVPLAARQPNPAFALRDGERITLLRTQPILALIRQIMTTTLGLLVMAAILEGGMIYLLPAVNPLYGYLNYSAPPPPAPSLLDWIVAGYFPALTLVAIIATSLHTLSGRREAIIADDRGVTVSKTLRRKRFIPWTEIKLFIQPVENKSDTPVGAYFLWGERRFFSVQVHGKAVTALNYEESQRVVDRHEYPGGYETYLENGRRLLATVAARGMRLCGHWRVTLALSRISVVDSLSLL